jgi:hypothetical protein
MRKELTIEITGAEGAGKTHAVAMLTKLFVGLGADVVWADGGPSEKAPKCDGPFNTFKGWWANTLVNIKTQYPDD